MHKRYGLRMASSPGPRHLVGRKEGKETRLWWVLLTLAAIPTALLPSCDARMV
jgi:hypothetical protein